MALTSLFSNLASGKRHYEYFSPVFIKLLSLLLTARLPSMTNAPDIIVSLFLFLATTSLIFGKKGRREILSGL